MTDENNGIGLTELLNQVKQELVAASTLATIKQSADGAIQPTDIPLFTYGNVELELQVTVKKDVKGGLKISVFEFGGGASRDDVQKIKVTLEPLFTKEELLDILKENNPKFLNYVKQYASYAGTKGSDEENLDDGIA
ncbi:MAG: trypco2 family protein [Pseudanabaena sp. ELA607]